MSLFGFLGLIGSLASIIGIPLSIYLYFKGNKRKYIELRKEIVKVLSHQIGEGRSLTKFEIHSVINSKKREYGVDHHISIREVIEDLVNQTITSPMLTSENKEAIICNLKEIYGGNLENESNVIKVEDLVEIKHNNSNPSVINLHINQVQGKKNEESNNIKSKEDTRQLLFQLISLLFLGLTTISFSLIKVNDILVRLIISLWISLGIILILVGVILVIKMLVSRNKKISETRKE